MPAESDFRLPGHGLVIEGPTLATCACGRWSCTAAAEGFERFAREAFGNHLFSVNGSERLRDSETKGKTMFTYTVTEDDRVKERYTGFRRLTQAVVLPVGAPAGPQLKVQIVLVWEE